MLIKNNLDNHTANLFVIRSVEPLQNDPNSFKISLRVPEKSNVDASKIARQFGGNGHEKAAGCIMTGEDFENL
jgi:nanoRNase/pAp phosphatase (c-di-AMP/oligoRNAs hydrolase)